MSRKILIVICLLAAVFFAWYLFSDHDKIDYNTQVKPIFNAKCITCHGGVKQKSEFSLLFREEALGHTKSGKPAIVPGKPGESELIRRITETDPDERMPYKHEKLSKNEIKILTQWIKQGAEWGEHWAYIPVKKQDAPDINNEWVKNDIDRFIYKKLKEEKLKPSAAADKATILRRVSLDLTGLPPTETIAKKFLTDDSEKAYENLIDDLLASTAYGERWTSLWLDLSRYADTKGYERDPAREIWRYRDWLIKAFNKDEPYNQFLIEQIAGDLMPGADDDKYIATAFHRNTMTNDEGGTDNEEFRTAAVMDRVNTTWSVLLGTTFNCVQCHSHPYDPFKHDEYYKFLAFFNNSRDEDTYSDYPLLRHYADSAQQKINELVSWVKQNTSEKKSDEIKLFLKTWQPAVNSLRCDKYKNSALLDTKWLGMRNNGECRLQEINLSGKNEIIIRFESYLPGGKWSIRIDSANGQLVKSVILPKTENGFQFFSFDIDEVNGVHDLYFSFTNPNLKNADQTGARFDWFYFTEKFPGADKPGFADMQKQFWSLMELKPEATPVMVENPADLFRTSNVFERGNWLVKGDKVTPDVPHILNPMPANAPKNRLGLAMWLSDKKNPLTARTMVNRLWEQLFGYGLVETLEDFGSQGIPPTHKELLDHLSWKFMNDFNWSIKKLLKEIVLSATYRQDSKTNEELQKKDPYNKFYARGPRIRLSAEQLRDQSLAVSNLLSNKMYGKSVMPFQPDGIWRSPYDNNTWVLSKGEDQNRRALYTYWKRTAPYPSMITFDGGAREVCVTRRIRTNTPLQALAALNDSSYLIMARYFAYKMRDSGGREIKNQLENGYEAMMYKPASEKKMNALIELYNKSIAKFKNDKEAVCEILGEMDKNNNAETAALVVVANAMLNLDEWVNKN